MFNKLFILVALLALVMLAGCSDDPVSSDDNPDNTVTSSWDADNNYWVTVLDASDSTGQYVHFSFTDRDTVSMAKVAATSWDIAFNREIGKLNGGSSTMDNSTVVGVNLGVVDYNAVTIADTAAAEWVSDAIDYFIDPWYTYNPQTHGLNANQYVWSMVDAGGSNYVKFRVDSIVGAAQPPDMGAVWITYYYQTTTSDLNLSGATSTAMIDVGAGSGFFDFSAGAQTTPTNPATDLNWDIAFNNYNCFQNSGPFGAGDCAAFPAHGELDDPINIDGFTAQPAGTPMFSDNPSSVLTEWYDYNPTTHQLGSKGRVYLIDSGTAIYKLRVQTYYAIIGGSPVSAHYTLIWNEL